ncbi:PqqD family protein [Methanospirillum stamsii]|uniref:PqqD family protein n=1 Tax=Methanospirillum stamsii TaxID=1277351 RepID=A0A2V2N8Y8_9EURY|nr:PqqD family protein [Methanospirillum stamsii]PWR71743.1 hypothetical protein DLD82_13400 [Methanospirillum stamsii]
MVTINELTLSSIPTKNPSVVSRKGLDDHLIIVNCDIGSSIVLNSTGAFIWEKIDGKRDVDQIVMDVKNYYDDDSDRIREDVMNVISSLKKDGFIGYEIISGISD